MFKTFAFVVVATTLAAGCAGDDHPRWEPERLGAEVVGLVDEFDAHALEVDEPWERSPTLLAGEFLRVDRAEAARIRIDAEQPGEGTGPATATVTLDGLLDDSIAAERYVLRLARDGEVWRLRSAQWSQSCRPGRGHVGFSTEPCI